MKLKKKTIEQLSQESEDKMRVFVNMIIDRVLEDRKNGKFHSETVY